jgi:hypothetical protein
MGCRLNDIAGIAAGVNTVPEGIWRSSPRQQAFQTDTSRALFQELSANPIFAALGRNGRGSVSN